MDMNFAADMNDFDFFANEVQLLPEYAIDEAVKSTPTLQTTPGQSPKSFVKKDFQLLQAPLQAAPAIPGCMETDFTSLPTTPVLFGDHFDGCLAPIDNLQTSTPEMFPSFIGSSENWVVECCTLPDSLKPGLPKVKEAREANLPSTSQWTRSVMYSSLKYRFYHDFPKILAGKMTCSFQLVYANSPSKEVLSRESKVVAVTKDTYQLPVVSKRTQVFTRVNFTSCSYHVHNEKFKLRMTYSLNGEKVMVALSPAFLVRARRNNKKKTLTSRKRRGVFASPLDGSATKHQRPSILIKELSELFHQSSPEERLNMRKDLARAIPEFAMR